MEKISATGGFEEWRQHWILLLCSAIGASMALMAVASLGVFLLPIQGEFGWTRAQISAGFTVYAIIGAVGAPVMGYFIDRYGTRKIAIGGAVGEGLAFALFALTTGSLVSWFGLWVVFSIATQGTRPVVWTAAISSCFDKSRGPAMAMVFVGTAMGHALAPILASHLIGLSGWRFAYVAMGLSWGGLTALLCYLFFRPRTPSRPPATIASEVEDKADLQIARLLLSRPFILLATPMFLGNALNMSFSVHLVPLLVGKGMSSSEAALLVGLGGLGSIVGTLSCGMLVLRFRGFIVAGSIALGPVIYCCLFLTADDGLFGRVVPVVLLSIAAGAQTHMFAYLASRYFDLRAYGRIYGTLSAVVAIGVGVGPVVGGLVFDNFKSYHPMIAGAIPVALLISSLLFLLGRLPEKN